MSAPTARRARGDAGLPAPGTVLPGYVGAWGEWVETPRALAADLATRFGVAGLAGGSDPAPGGARSARGTTAALAPFPARAEPDWGVSAQLYACSTERSWGTGDLADLARLAAGVRSLGGTWVLVSPLCAPGTGDRTPDSPYSPSTRRFLDPLLVAPDLVDARPADPGRLASLHTQARAAARTPGGRPRPLVDRRAVAARKLEALALLHAGSWDRTAFEAYRRERGASLERFARWSAVAEQHGADWRRWPAALRRADDRALARAAAAHPERVELHAWCQWQAERQLAAAAREARLLGDMPFGFAADGFDAWCWQDLAASGVGAGAPPDDLGPHGQAWGFPVLRPDAVLGLDAAPLRETATALVRHLAGLRVDHVLGFWRTWVVPDGGEGADGAYVAMAPSAFLDAVHEAVAAAGGRLVAEALGVPGPGVHAELARRSVATTEVGLWADPHAPYAGPRHALLAWTNHDLPTTAGLWSGADARIRARLGLGAAAARSIAWRANVGARVARRWGTTRVEPTEAVRAVVGDLGAADVETVVVELADLAVVEAPQNVPGVGWPAWPSFRQRLPVDLDELLAGGLARAVAADLDAAGRAHRG